MNYPSGAVKLEQERPESAAAMQRYAENLGSNPTARAATWLAGLDHAELVWELRSGGS